MFENIKSLHPTDHIEVDQTILLMDIFDKAIAKSGISKFRTIRKLQYCSTAIDAWTKREKTPRASTVARMIEYCEDVLGVDYSPIYSETTIKPEPEPELKLASSSSDMMISKSDHVISIKKEIIHDIKNNKVNEIYSKLTGDTKLVKSDMSDMLNMMYQTNQNVISEEDSHRLMKLLLGASLSIGIEKVNEIYNSYASLIDLFEAPSPNDLKLEVVKNRVINEEVKPKFQMNSFSAEPVSSPKPVEFTPTSTTVVPKSISLSRYRNEARRLGGECNFNTRASHDITFNNVDIVSLAVCHIMGYIANIYGNLYKEMLFVEISGKLHRNGVLMAVNHHDIRMNYQSTSCSNLVVNPEDTLVVNYDDSGMTIAKNLIELSSIHLKPNEDEYENINRIWKMYQSIIVN